MRLATLLWLSTAWFTASTSMTAQLITGAITGTISDPSSAAIPGARVVVIEENTNVTSETVSDAQGGYSFPALRSGVYRVEVEAQGFRRLVRSGLQVRVNDHLRVDLTMIIWRGERKRSGDRRGAAGGK